MALSAIPPVTGEVNLIKVEYPPTAINGEVACQFFTGMDSVNHEAEVN